MLQFVREPLSLAVAAATTGLARKLHRTPTTAEIATHLGVDPHELATALGAAQAAFLTALNAHHLEGPWRVDLPDPGPLGVGIGSYPGRFITRPTPRSRWAATIAGGSGEQRDPAAGPSRMDVVELVRATVARLGRDLHDATQPTEPGGDVLSRGEDVTTRHATLPSRRSAR
ncbi:sigma-70 domain-containing protein [Longispora urticae]